MPGSRQVVVVGSGAAGMAAAVAAAGEGAAVTVLEAAARLGGTTATSGGGAWFPANPWAAAEGVEDSGDQALRYLEALGEESRLPPLAAAFVRESTRVARLIEARTALRWGHLNGRPDYHPELDGASVGGRSVEIHPVQVPAEARALVRDDPYGSPPISLVESESASPPDAAELARRVREGVTARGRGLIAGLTAALLDHGGTVRTRVRVTELARSGDAVTGVRVDGTEIRGSVILANGGFERNAAFVAAYLRGPMVAPAGPPTNVGDALRMGLAAGAGVANMSEAWWVAATHVPGETIDGAPFFRMLFTEPPQPGGIVVDSTGRRFANEAVSYYAFGRALHEHNENTVNHARVPSWLVFDSVRRHEGIGPLSADGSDPDWLSRAASLRGLAGSIGVPADTLAGTVERFNAGAADGADEQFGRGSFEWDRRRYPHGTLRPLSEPPFYAFRVLPGASGTNGGLCTDEHGRVLRLADGAPVPGLHAAGNAAAYMAGARYPGPGATIGPALVFGWRAGEAAARG